MRVPLQRQDAPELVEAMLVQIQNASGDFATLAAKIVTSLHVHPDQDCRSLSMRLAFNEFYKITRPQTKSSTPGPS